MSFCDRENKWKFEKLTKNELEFLLTTRFNTKKTKALNMSSIIDFPKLEREEIKNNIVFGSFQLKQSESYPKSFEQFIKSSLSICLFKIHQKL